VVLAGAGSGKTRALVHRVAKLISDGVAADTIVLCTFTHRAARELTTRIESLIGPRAQQVRSGTIHSLAHRLLEEHGGMRYRILDRGDADALLADALAESSAEDAHSIGLPRAPLVRSLYGRAIAEQRTLAEIVKKRAPRWTTQIAALEAALDEYARRKAAAGAVDFDDLLLFSKILLTEKRPSLGIEHVLVDEYQDVTRLQAELLALLGGSLMVVGDPDQSIYSFRGADANLLLNAKRQYLTLDVNYRSTPEIIAAANRVSGRSLRAARPDGGRRPARVELDDDRQQALFVAARMGELIDGGQAPSELAALYRTHAHGVALELELTRQRLPFQVRSGARFAEQAHVKDVVAFLQLAIDPRDPLAWSRVARQLPGVGARSAERIVEAGRLLGLDALLDRALHQSLPAPARRALAALTRLELRPEAAAAELVARILERGDDDDEAHREDLRLLSRLADGASSVGELLEALLLRPESEAADAITLSTIHQAKGLEWRSVFVLSLVEGRCPLPAREPEDLHEERRLFYVAVTRARDELYLCRPQREGPLPLVPSRFLLELDGLCDRWSVVSSALPH
jgi:DNA helicase-2/ATP-dependent DNA helicase PcrA